MVELHDTEVDGVRCFWVETGRPTLAAQLMFRQGIVDEGITRSGWLHLLEHLALLGRGGGALEVNGAVSLLTVSFTAHGPVAAVSRHLTDLTRWLTAPELDGLGHERGVLQAESGLRGGPTPRAMAMRFGARGPGVAAYDEPGLGRADEANVRELAARAFARGNAVLMLDGPPPPDLQLVLPPGERLPARPTPPCDDPRPGAYVDEAGLVLSGVVERSWGGGVLAELLRRRLVDRFRHDARAAYAPWSTYERVDEDEAVVVAGTDLLPSVHPTAAREALDLVSGLATDGPWSRDLAEVIEGQTQAMQDPYAAFGIALQAGHAVLSGKEARPLAEMLEQVRAVDADDVRRLAGQFADSLLLGVPTGAPVPDHVPLIRQPGKTGWVAGRRFRHRDWPAVPVYVVVDDADAHLVEEPVHHCYHADDVAGLFVFGDGGRHVLLEEGWGLTIEPPLWRRGERLVSELDAMVPADRHLPMPARPDRDHGRAMPLPKRLWVGRKQLFSPYPAAAALAVLLAGLLVLSVVLGRYAVAVSLGVAAVLGGRLAWHHRRHRVYRGRHS